MIDADTAQFRSVAVADPIDRILLFPAGGNLPPTKALFASIASKQKRVHVLDLEHIADPLTPASIRTIAVAQPVRDVVPVPSRELAMIVHDDARTVLGLLDMGTESTSPLLGVGKLDSYDFTPNGSYLIGATTGVGRLGFVALDNLHPTDFRLDDTPARVLSTANAKIFVDHGDPLGHATIIPSPEARRDEALVLQGFLHRRAPRGHTMTAPTTPTIAPTAARGAAPRPLRGAARVAAGALAGAIALGAATPAATRRRAQRG